MKATQPSLRRRAAAAVAHLPNSVAAVLKEDRVPGEVGVTGAGWGGCGCRSRGRLVGLDGGSGEIRCFALPNSQGSDNFSSRSAI